MAEQAAGPGGGFFAGQEPPEPATEDEKLWGLLAYLIAPCMLGAIIGLVTKGQSKFVKFHALQQIFFGVSMMVVGFVVWIFAIVIALIPFVGWLVCCVIWVLWMFFALALLALWVLLMVRAFGGKIVRIPLVGNLAYKMAYGG